MTKYDTSISEIWKKNDVIRNKITGKPLLVIHIYRFVATIVVDLEENKTPSSMFVLLPRDYDKFAVDNEMEAEQNAACDDIISWSMGVPVVM